MKTIEKVVSKNMLKTALKNEASFKAVRTIELYSNSTANGTRIPRYRIFDILPGSVYEVMGLMNADILIGINDRIIVNPALIGAAIRLMPEEKESQIELVRNEVSMLLKYKFID